ncbi:Lrp/AsnC family transcriptional regulator [Burkholderia cenocepacia]|uniref:Lrp/AsnC family transcriptional regulator n=1 Tax=Burkholderia cenocepacia TaxID=95486 RepID=UPI00286F3FF5|nr:Lrp/AsnC family transcriptional regulator [Burkholderia cenocepacia]
MECKSGLDRIDIHILRELAADGRLSSRDLAERIGLSLTPTLRRVRHLEEEGYIRGYVAQLDESRLVGPVSVFVSVSLTKQSEAVIACFESEISAVPEVMSCFLMTGDADYILRVVVSPVPDPYIDAHPGRRAHQVQLPAEDGSDAPGSDALMRGRSATVAEESDGLRWTISKGQRAANERSMDWCLPLCGGAPGVVRWRRDGPTEWLHILYRAERRRARSWSSTASTTDTPMTGNDVSGSRRYRFGFIVVTYSVKK